jgi:cellulose biosynthesis protein BcsQ
MPLRTPRRAIVTFYSYKGGVGRSLALANVAWRLADRHGLRVLLVDWDLEAPGLHHFLGIPTADLRERSGILDFFDAWKVAIDERASVPPDVHAWPVPVTHSEVVPVHGQLSILHAGRQDDTYAVRLAAFDWRELYARHEGAAAVETLREQLAQAADVVLVDSRTGLTDASGICTAQLPDAVVLMSAHNMQSLEGIEHVARTIGRQQAYRRDRPSPTLWFALGRAPDSNDGQQWLAEHDERWFRPGVAAGLWQDREHPRGMSTWSLPQDARWVLGEPLLKRAASSSPLGVALDEMAAKVFLWHFGATEALADSHASMDEARAALVGAEERADELGLCIALIQLARAHRQRSEYPAAIHAYGRACGMAESLRLIPLRNLALEGAGQTLASLGERDEAQRNFTRALEPLEHPGVVSSHWHAALHRTMAAISRKEQRWREALASLAGAAEDARLEGDIVLERDVLREQVDVAIEGALPDEGLRALARRMHAYGQDESDAWTYNATVSLGRAWVALHGDALEDAIETLRIDTSFDERTTLPTIWYGLGLACANAGLGPTARALLDEALTGFAAVGDELWAERTRNAQAVAIDRNAPQ